MSLSVVEASPRLHGLPPIVDQRSVLLVLGSFPSVKSLEKREYYGHPQNHFWLLMEQGFGIDRTLRYEERVAALLGSRVAVWDVIESCRRPGSADQAIEEPEVNHLELLLGRHPRIQHVALNGTTAYQTLRRHIPELLERQGLAFHRLPSSSPRLPLQRKVEAWSEVRDWLKEQCR